MKKSFSIVAFIVALIFAGCMNNLAEARDPGIYVGTFKDGYNAYVMLSLTAGYRNDFKTAVLASKGNDSFCISYEFWYSDGWYFSNSQGFRKKVGNQTPIAKNILNCVLNNMNLPQR